jgi:hypothetical protein
VPSQCEPDDVGRRLDAALPDGIDVIEVVEAAGKSGEAQREASEWEVILPGVPAAAADSAVRKFLASPSVEVERLTSKGTKTLDARAAVLSLVNVTGTGTDRSVSGRRDATGPAPIESGAACAILRMIVRRQAPAVRPEDILAALRQLSALEPASPPLVTRLWQGPLSALTAAETGAQPGMTVACDATGPGRPDQQSADTAPSAVPSAGIQDAALHAQAAPSASAHTEGLPEPAAQRPDPVPGHEEHQSRSATDKAMQVEAKSAASAPASQLRANEQLPRGTLGQLADLRAREPYGRDRPDARNRANKSTVRIQ